MKILILGANGFIGNALVSELCKDDTFQIYGLDLSDSNLEQSINNPNFHFVEGDINISNEWIEYQIRKCDIIIPLVAIATPNIYVKDPLKVFELDFEANLKIVKWVAKYKKRIIFPSTSEVYGMCTDKEFNEYSSNLVLGPVHKSRWIYSASKQLLDRVIIGYGEKGKLMYTLFRPFNWIGPKLDSLKQAQLGNGRVLTIFIYNILHNKDIVLVEGGEQSRSFTYLNDGIDALTKIIKNNSGDLNGKIFNIGNPKNNISIKELAKLLIEEYNEISPKNFTGNIVKKTQKEFYGKGYEDISVRIPDIEEAKNFLDWYPITGVRESVRETLKYFIREFLNSNNKI
jgi:nucleoside-diphosphate-sugar epimerase